MTPDNSALEAACSECHAVLGEDVWDERYRYTSVSSLFEYNKRLFCYTCLEGYCTYHQLGLPYYFERWEWDEKTSQPVRLLSDAEKLAAAEARVTAVDAELVQALAALKALVDDYREVDWHCVPADVQHDVVEVLGDTTAKTKHLLFMYAKWAAEDEAASAANADADAADGVGA